VSRLVLLEAGVAGQWREGAAIRPGDALGSISRIEATGRQVYLFGFQDGVAGVWRSTGGIDRGDGTPVREVRSIGLDLVSDLAQPLELAASHGRPAIRFRLVDRDA
jgi:hypothetical protein